MKKTFAVILLSFFTVAFCACEVLILGGAGALVGAGGYRYYEGELKADLDARMLDVWDASKKALEELKYAVEEATPKATEAKLKASKPKEEDVTVKLKYLAYNKTQIGIRVGFFGDKERSVAILNRIQQVLRSK